MKTIFPNSVCRSGCQDISNIFLTKNNFNLWVFVLNGVKHITHNSQQLCFVFFSLCLFSVKNDCYIFHFYYLLEIFSFLLPLRIMGHFRWSCVVFPWHFCDQNLYQNTWGKNLLLAIVKKFFKVLEFPLPVSKSILRFCAILEVLETQLLQITHYFVGRGRECLSWLNDAKKIWLLFCISKFVPQKQRFHFVMLISLKWENIEIVWVCVRCHVEKQEWIVMHPQQDCNYWRIHQ